AEPVAAPAPPVSATATAISNPTATPVSDPAATLLSEAEALESKGQRIAPAGQNAAEHYVRVLQAEPDSQVARARLDKIVSSVATDAGDMILRQRFDGARRSLEQLAVAIPESHRSLVGKEARGQWRVVGLLLD